jgi:trk system potassium uptake protein TrkA
VARETFGVEHVVARIYDPGRAEVYQRLGIPTVATVKWTADQMLRRLLPQGHVPELVDPSGNVVIAEVTVNPAWVGHRLSELEEATGSRAAYLTRLGSAILPSADSVFQEGDLLHLASLASELATVERTLDAPPVVTEH